MGDGRVGSQRNDQGFGCARTHRVRPRPAPRAPVVRSGLRVTVRADFVPRERLQRVLLHAALDRTHRWRGARRRETGSRPRRRTGRWGGL